MRVFSYRAGDFRRLRRTNPAMWLEICLAALACWILLSGLDDLFIDLAAVWLRLGRRVQRPAPANAAEKAIAIFVPLWREHAVIGAMLRHNASAIRYRNCHFFCGCYPNDPETRAALERTPLLNLHVAVCPRPGPTSKADCLNAIYREMLAFEQRSGARFDIVLLHDAEDLIHPDSLRLVNLHAGTEDMVQVPVLPLASPFGEFTHGVYCDEFAQHQTRDLPVRQALGGWLPSCGVGTAYRRPALEKLAALTPGQPFDPGCLTEDYDSGYRLRRLGCRQRFVPVRFTGGHPVATREFFPRTMKGAVRQRVRWVTGIALQGWQRHGWGSSFSDVYWFWRDRKGLVGSPVSFLANCAAVTTDFYESCPPLFAATGLVLLLRLAVRCACSVRIYGWLFAAGAPARALWGNWINCAATVLALWQYCRARLRRRRLAWLKTDHCYPPAATLVRHKGLIGEILVSQGLITPAELDFALRAKPRRTRLGEFLTRLGRISEEDFYRALCLQFGLPLSAVPVGEVRPSVARMLPRRLCAKWRVLPFRIEPGVLHVAGADFPDERFRRALRGVAPMRIRFHLVTPANLDSLRAALAHSADPRIR